MWIGWRNFWPILVTLLGAAVGMAVVTTLTIENDSLRDWVNLGAGLFFGYAVIGPWYTSKMRW